MVTNKNVLTINRPLPEVFDYLSDFQNSTKWQSGLVEVKGISEEPMAAGYQFTGVRNFMGRRLEALVELTSFEQNKQFAYKSLSKSLPFNQTFLFETTAEGTQLTSLFEMETSGLMGLAKPLIVSSLKRDMSADFATLKNLLENGVPEAAAK
jgi:hypothetical protein